MLFRRLLTQLPTMLAVSWLWGENHLVFLCRPPLSSRVLPLTSLAGVLSRYPTCSVLAESNLTVTLPRLPSLPALLMPQPASSRFCNFSPKPCPTPTSHTGPLHPVPPYLLLPLPPAHWCSSGPLLLGCAALGCSHTISPRWAQQEKRGWPGKTNIFQDHGV